jgi:hypothetical protein
MRIFKLSWIKVLSTIILSSLLIFFYVPIDFQYCQPIEGEFGGGGCGPGFTQSTIYPLPNIPQPTPIDDVPYHPPVENVIFYPLSQITFQGIPQVTSPTKNASYPYSLPLSLIMILVSYVLSCLLIEGIYKLKKKIYPAPSKK